MKYSPIFGPLVKFIFVKPKPVKNESKKNQTQQLLCLEGRAEFSSCFFL